MVQLLQWWLSHVKRLSNMIVWLYPYVVICVLDGIDEINGMIGGILVAMPGTTLTKALDFGALGLWKHHVWRDWWKNGRTGMVKSMGLMGCFFLLRCFSFCFQQRSLKNCLPFAFAIRNAPIQSDGNKIESGIFFEKKAGWSRNSKSGRAFARLKFTN